MRVAVTGAAGRLGRALITALEDAPFTGPAGPIAWDRSAFDLDAPDGIEERLVRDRAEVVVHAAAWTDVDGCALDPALAMRRNATATGVLALACARMGVDLLVISTNEVFDGLRTDSLAYRPDDTPAPGNPYGVSKASAERLAIEAFATALAPASASLARPGCSARRVAIFRAGSSMPPSEPGMPARRCAPSATSGARRATPRTWRPPWWNCWPRTAWSGSITS